MTRQQRVRAVFSFLILSTPVFTAANAGATSHPTATANPASMRQPVELLVPLAPPSTLLPNPRATAGQMAATTAFTVRPLDTAPTRGSRATSQDLVPEGEGGRNEFAVLGVGLGIALIAILRRLGSY